jgi:hypothetical protein
MIIERLSPVNDSTAVLPPARTTFRRRSLSESSVTRAMRAQPPAMLGSVDSRSWLIAKSSASCAHALETDAATTKNVVPKIRRASIMLEVPS